MLYMFSTSLQTLQFSTQAQAHAKPVIRCVLLRHDAAAAASVAPVCDWLKYVCVHMVYIIPYVFGKRRERLFRQPTREWGGEDLIIRYASWCWLA